MEMVDLFRCVRAHRESWLVAAIDEVDGRVILSGRLGCPVCSTEYEIRNGVLEMSAEVPHGSEERPQADPWRIAALLDLQQPSATVVLEGARSQSVEALLAIVPGRVVALNPVGDPAPQERLAVVRSHRRIPLRSASVESVALTAATDTALTEAVRVLRTGGRLLAPAGAPVPAGLREIARDEQEWVAVSELSHADVQLTRR
jgi:hypothetical protein